MHFHLTFKNGLYGLGLCLGPVGFYIGFSFPPGWVRFGSKLWYESEVLVGALTISRFRLDTFIYHRFEQLRDMEKMSGAVIIADKGAFTSG